MYQIKLNENDSRRLKKIIRKMMIEKEYSVHDLSVITGYQEGSIYNYLNSEGCSSRFIAAALCDALDITVGGKK